MVELAELAGVEAVTGVAEFAASFSRLLALLLSFGVVLLEEVLLGVLVSALTPWLAELEVFVEFAELAEFVELAELVGVVEAVLSFAVALVELEELAVVAV